MHDTSPASSPDRRSDLAPGPGADDKPDTKHACDNGQESAGKRGGEDDRKSEGHRKGRRTRQGGGDRERGGDRGGGSDRDPDPTPSAKPSAKPEPTPTPSAKPEPTPNPRAKPSAKPEPTPNPRAKPEPTPSAKSEPNPTPRAPGGNSSSTPPVCLVTGATGYIGGRLVPELLAAGYAVRCLARTPAKLRDHPWADRVEVRRGDVTDATSLAGAFDGVDVAYYLVHGLGGGRDFEKADREAARLFAREAEAAGVRRIVYLGGLTPQGVPERDLSPHLRSRAEVGRILLASGVPTAVLRAAVVIGSGSASFEMLRYLTERLPVMVTPRWVDTRIQPIAVRDVLRLLVGAAALPEDVNRTFDIGGPDVLTYRQMMHGYAKAAGLPGRLILSVPVLTPRLSSQWVGLVTPVPGALARPLTESLRHEVVCRERDIARYVPDLPGGPIGFLASLDLALRRVREADVATRWSSAGVPGAPSDPLPTDPDWAGGSLYTDVRERTVDAPPAELWRVIEGIGGENGWYSFPLAWAVRGWLDRLVGGVGLRRGRRDAARLRVGDSLDFWRVEEIRPGELLRLRAEMRLPGLAWLELAVATDEDGTTRYRQRALFHPHGLSGHLYWWSVAPFHAAVFGGMARNITAACASPDTRASARTAAAPLRKPPPRRRF